MKRATRTFAGWLGIFALVFAQLAVAAYACPSDSRGDGATPEARFTPPCEQIDRERTNLCEKHCHDAEQSQSASPALHGAFVPGFIAVVALPPPKAFSAFAGDPALLHATSPPITIRNHCFRI